jgi:uncharacterized membrane protein
MLSLWPFLIIVALTGLVMVPNALYGFRQYLSNRNLIWLAAYFILLFSFAFLVVHVTKHTLEIVEQAKELLAQPDL